MTVAELEAASAPLADAMSPLRAGGGRMALRIRERRLLLALGDLLTGSLSFFAAYSLLRPRMMHDVPLLEPLLYGLAWVVALFLVNGYGFQIPTSRMHSTIAVAKALPLAGLMAVLGFFLYPYSASRPLIVLAAVIGAGCLVLFRTTVARLLLHEALAVRAILLGRTEPRGDIRETLHAARFECQVVATLLVAGDAERVEAVSTDDLSRLIQAHHADEVIVTSNDLRLLPGLAEECLSHGVRVVSAGTLVEHYMGRVPLESVDAHWYMNLPDNQLWERPYAAVRWIADLMIALVISVPFLALLPFLALAIKIESPGPVFFTQQRVGQHGKQFRLLKLRTMRSDAEASGVQLAARQDPRVTRVGRLLRDTRLDEVPQLLNIVRGDMSFIGPRPERPELMSLLETHVPRFRSRLLVKPGLTGWAQVRSGYASTMTQMRVKLEYDLYYIKNRSLRLDLQILALTCWTVLARQGW